MVDLGKSIPTPENRDFVLRDFAGTRFLPTRRQELGAADSEHWMKSGGLLMPNATGTAHINPNHRLFNKAKPRQPSPSAMSSHSHASTLFQHSRRIHANSPAKRPNPGDFFEKTANSARGRSATQGSSIAGYLGYDARRTI